MRGPKPKPVEQRRLEGNPGKRKLPEPMLVAGRPAHELDKPPADLSRDAKAYWRSTVRRLIDAGMIDLVDEVALRMLATKYARWREAGRAIAEHGLISIGSHGQPMTHPAVRIERDAHRDYFAVAPEFGLTPSGRMRLGLQELHRRRLGDEMDRALGDVDAIDAEVVDDGDDDIGLPGAA